MATVAGSGLAPGLGIEPLLLIVPAAIAAKTPVVSHSPTSPASICFKKIAASLIGQDYTPASTPQSLLRKIKSALGIERPPVLSLDDLRR